MNLKTDLNTGLAMKTSKLIFALLAVLALAACGGGSSGSFDGGREARLTVTPLQTTIEAQAFECRPSVQVNVRFVQANGSIVADGTSVTLSSANVAIGRVGPLAGTGGPDDDATPIVGGSATAATAGGVAQFRFFSGAQTGQVTLTASAANPSGVGTISATAVMTVTESTCEAPPQGPEFELQVLPLAASMESNPSDLAPNPQAPYTVQVNVSFRASDGSVVPNGTEVSLASSSAALGRISPIEDPSQIGASATSPTVGGVASFWVTSRAAVGTLTLTASAVRPADEDEVGETVTASATIEVVPSSGTFGPKLEVVPLASTVEANPRGLAPNPAAPYTVQVNVEFTLSNGDPVPDGTAVNLATGSSVVGQVSPLDSPEQSAGVASSQTSGGVARFWFTSGSQTGSVSLTASATNPEEPGTVTGQRALAVVPAETDFGPRLTVEPLLGAVEANPQGFTPSLDARYTTQVNVRFTLENGEPVADGTTVQLSSADVTVGLISALESPEATDRVIEASTAGGVASFLFTAAAQTGQATLTASASNPSPGDSGTITGFGSIQILDASDTTGRLSVLGADTMPTNRLNVPIFLGSPYINELSVLYRGPDGEPGAVTDAQISVAVFPVNRGAFSTLDDPSTPDVNEFFVLLGSGPVTMTAGVSTVFVHSFDRPGALTVAIQAVDVDTGERFSTNFVIDIEDGAADFLPADISLGLSPDPVYVQGSGGATTKSITLTVLDSGGNPVPNPEANGTSFNNVRLQLEAPAGSGARLTGTGSDGPVTGTEIDVRTVNGIANFALNSGSATGSHRVIATVDQADNNVDNDLQDPLTAETTVQVGDGRLFSLELVSPVAGAIRINPVVGEILSSEELVIDPETGLIIPPNPDGTYSLRVTVQASDRVGNPTLEGTPIRLGKIDAPLTPDLPREFVFSGLDGDPEEGGVLFTVEAPPVGFLDDPLQVDESVEPGDTLALFGKLVPGNRDHEAVRFVASVVDDATLTVTEPFNLNDGTGAVVDDGPVIPWVIGRSQVGVIEPDAIIGADGRASVFLTYPINQLGRPLVLWAQGVRSAGETTPVSVADVEAIVFPGAAPLVLTATPDQIPGNQEVSVLLCLRDGLGTPIEGAFIGAALESTGPTATVDGLPLGAGGAQTASATGTNGCVNTQVATQGLLPDDPGTTIVFFFGQAQARVEVAPAGSAVLTVSPATFIDQFQGPVNVALTLRLIDSSGAPISGIGLSGNCPAAGVRLINNPGVTNDQGFTNAIVEVNLFSCDAPIVGSFDCSFTTPTGTPVGTFTAVGRAPADLAFVSPPCP